ncbi:dynein light chain binding protein [Aureococcus anophagefferens]|nr:dynein light chain binding protein [Aureococcus anophagefferens]
MSTMAPKPPHQSARASATSQYRQRAACGDGREDAAAEQRLEEHDDVDAEAGQRRFVREVLARAEAGRHGPPQRGRHDDGGRRSPPRASSWASSAARSRGGARALEHRVARFFCREMSIIFKLRHGCMIGKRALRLITTCGTRAITTREARARLRNQFEGANDRRATKELEPRRRTGASQVAETALKTKRSRLSNADEKLERSGRGVEDELADLERRVREHRDAAADVAETAKHFDRVPFVELDVEKLHNALVDQALAAAKRLLEGVATSVQRGVRSLTKE